MSPLTAVITALLGPFCSVQVLLGVERRKILYDAPASYLLIYEVIYNLKVLPCSRFTIFCQQTANIKKVLTKGL